MEKMKGDDEVKDEERWNKVKKIILTADAICCRWLLFFQPMRPEIFFFREKFCINIFLLVFLFSSNNSILRLFLISFKDFFLSLDLSAIDRRNKKGKRKSDNTRARSLSLFFRLLISRIVCYEISSRITSSNHSRRGKLYIRSDAVAIYFLPPLPLSYNLSNCPSKERARSNRTTNIVQHGQFVWYLYGCRSVRVIEIKIDNSFFRMWR